MDHLVLLKAFIINFRYSFTKAYIVNVSILNRYFFSFYVSEYFLEIFCVNIYLPNPLHDTRSFLSWVYQVWIQSIPFRPIALPRLKSLVCPTIYILLEREFLDACFFLRVLAVFEMQATEYRFWTHVAMSDWINERMMKMKKVPERISKINYKKS